MTQKSIDELKEIIGSDWPKRSDEKTKSYIDKFFDRTLNANKIIAKVEGNHGVYTVSIEAKEKETDSACSCYIGSDGGCHHCHALALTFLKDPESFALVRQKKLSSIRTLDDLEKYLTRTKLDTLLQELKSRGITNKDFAEAMGMNPRHLSSINSSEKRNRFYNELGATKLACLWVIEHVKKK
jgi:uncharacterized Zn finger protein